MIALQRVNDWVVSESSQVKGARALDLRKLDTTYEVGRAASEFARAFLRQWAHGGGILLLPRKQHLESLFLESHSVVGVPDALRPTFNVIQSSRQILDMKDGWDGEASSSISQETWTRAARFLWRNAYVLWKRHGVRIADPRIVPAADGTIDVHWKVEGRELLINIPAEPDKRASYYGDDGAGGHVLEGDLDTSSSNHWLLMWLSE